MTAALAHLDDELGCELQSVVLNRHERNRGDRITNAKVLGRRNLLVFLRATIEVEGARHAFDRFVLCKIGENGRRTTIRFGKRDAEQLVTLLGDELGLFDDDGA